MCHSVMSSQRLYSTLRLLDLSSIFIQEPISIGTCAYSEMYEYCYCCCSSKALVCSVVNVVT